MSQSAAEVAYSAVDVVGAWDETPQLRAVRLDLGALGALHRAPGQALKIRSGDGESFFALATRPGEAHGEILIKRGPPLADSLVAEAQPGAQLQISAPAGRGFPVEEVRGRDVLLFAAGSGISPIRAVVRHILHVRREVGRVVLFYGQRHPGDFAYRDERPTWEGAGIETVLCCTQPDHGWAGGHGHVQDVARETSFAGVAPEGAVAFLCGMRAMVHAVRDALGKAGMPAERSHLNY